MKETNKQLDLLAIRSDNGDIVWSDTGIGKGTGILQLVSRPLASRIARGESPSDRASTYLTRQQCLGGILDQITNAYVPRRHGIRVDKDRCHPVVQLNA